VLLYQTLLKFGLAEGRYDARADDGVRLAGTRIVNAVRCVPPANLPVPLEIRTCNPFLGAELRSMPDLRVILALGVVAHAAVLRAVGLPVARIKFRHGQMVDLPGGVVLADSYHVSRYNTNTGVLTQAMFEQVVAAIVTKIE
jgi:uracil-DNA glycosylase family 4